jgi:hypothetical protein
VRTARRESISEIRVEHVDAALERTARSVEAAFDERIRLAFERGGEVQPRRRVLELLASSRDRELAAAQVFAAYNSRAFNARGKNDLLATALSQLVKPQYDAVLRRSGTRGRYRYRFADPSLRPYLRMKYFTRPVDERPIRADRDREVVETRKTVTIVVCDIGGSTGLAAHRHNRIGQLTDAPEQVLGKARSRARPSRSQTSRSRPNQSTPLRIINNPSRFSGRCREATRPAATNDQPIATCTGAGEVSDPGSTIAKPTT